MYDNLSGDVKDDTVQVDPPDCPIFKSAMMCFIIVLRIFILRAKIHVFLNSKMLLFCMMTVLYIWISHFNASACELCLTNHESRWMLSNSWLSFTYFYFWSTACLSIAGICSPFSRLIEVSLWYFIGAITTDRLASWCWWYMAVPSSKLLFHLNCRGD